MSEAADGTPEWPKYVYRACTPGEAQENGHKVSSRQCWNEKEVERLIGQGWSITITEALGE